MAATIQLAIKKHVPSAQITRINNSQSAASAVSIQNPSQAHLKTTHMYSLVHLAPLATRPEWADMEYRQAYLVASIEQGIAWQIKVNRQKRGLSQEELGELIGTTQSGVSRLEDPEYGNHSLESLVKLAHAFDCALSIKFVSYSRLAAESEDLSAEALYAKSFSDETK